MRLFNAFQMVAFFAAAPFGLSWINEQAFRGSSIAFWVGAAVYVVSFFMMVAAVCVGIKEIEG